MNLYLISQEENWGYDTFSSAVVCAADETSARNMSPRSGEPLSDYDSTSWVTDPAKVDVLFLGEADPNIEGGVVCSSFHAG